MDTSSANNETVSVDISTMGSWQSQIVEIATTNESVVTELTTLINSLDSIWQGTAATSFIEKYTNSLKELTIANEKIAGLSKALQIVVQTMQNE